MINRLHIPKTNSLIKFELNENLFINTYLEIISKLYKENKYRFA